MHDAKNWLKRVASDLVDFKTLVIKALTVTVLRSELVFSQMLRETGELEVWM